MLLVAEIMPATSDSVPLIGKLIAALITFILHQMRSSDFAWNPAVKQTTCRMACCNWNRKQCSGLTVRECAAVTSSGTEGAWSLSVGSEAETHCRKEHHHQQKQHSQSLQRASETWRGDGALSMAAGLQQRIGSPPTGLPSGLPFLSVRQHVLLVEECLIYVMLCTTLVLSGLSKVKREVTSHFWRVYGSQFPIDAAAETLLARHEAQREAETFKKKCNKSLSFDEKK